AELSDAPGASGVLISLWNSLVLGEGGLTANQRREIIEAASDQYRGMLEQYDATKGAHDGLAQSYGIDPKKVTIDRGIEDTRAMVEELPTRIGEMMFD